jgi:hypothetical protein
MNRFMEYFVMLLCFFSVFPFAYAGGEFSKEELVRLDLACYEQSRGDACLVLAENTMCGRGYNEETTQFMSQACAAYQKSCVGEYNDSCRSYAYRCLLPCFDIDSFSEMIICTLPSIYKDKSNKKINADTLLRYLAPSCSKKDTESCLILGKVLKDIDPLQSRVYLEKGCALYDAESCMRLGTLHVDEAKFLQEKACLLLWESKSDDFTYNQEYSSICADYWKGKRKK